MLSYYVEGHMIEAWRPLLFADEDRAAKAKRDPVAPAKRSAAVLEKVHTHNTGARIQEALDLCPNAIRLQHWQRSDYSVKAAKSVSVHCGPRRFSFCAPS